MWDAYLFRAMRIISQHAFCVRVVRADWERFVDGNIQSRIGRTMAVPVTWSSLLILRFPVLAKFCTVTRFYVILQYTRLFVTVFTALKTNRCDLILSNSFSWCEANVLSPYVWTCLAYDHLDTVLTGGSTTLMPYCLWTFTT